MTFQVFTPEAEEVKRRDKHLINIEKMRSLVADLFECEDGMDSYAGYDTSSAKALSAAFIEQLDGQDWQVVQIFAATFFQWIDEEQYTHLIPRKYTDAYQIIQQLKNVIQGEK